MIGFIGSPERSAHMLGFAVPVYFAVMTVSHHEVHNVVVSEIQFRERNDARTPTCGPRTSSWPGARHATRSPTWPTGPPSPTGSRTRSRRTADALGTLAVLYFDLDRFKVVNDSLGHAAGDELLSAVATRMKRLTRAGDLLARFGGDEFTMLLDNLHTPGEALEVAERIAASLDEPYQIGGRTIHVSASIGVAVAIDVSDNAETLISRADAAQYRAKQAGRNRVEMFDSQLRDSLSRRLDDEQQLREAITSGAIVAWYQPVVDLNSGLIVAAEALARWQHPVRGVLDAYNFVPLAEETGLILALDERVVTHAVTTRARLATDHLVDAPFRTWVNVSTTQFARANPTEGLANLLQETGCSPSFVGVEITETAVLENVDAAAAQIANRAQPRREGRARRFRRRALVAHAAAVAAHRHREDRPQLRPRHHDRAARRRDRREHRRSRGQARDRGRCRRNRDARTGRTATRARVPCTRRATSGRRRCRSTRSPPGCAAPILRRGPRRTLTARRARRTRYRPRHAGLESHALRRTTRRASARRGRRRRRRDPARC